MASNVKNNRTPSGLLAVLGEPLVGKPKSRTPLYRTVRRMASPLSDPHLSSITHTHSLAYAAVARDTTAATAGAVDGTVDPVSSTTVSRWSLPF